LTEKHQLIIKKILEDSSHESTCLGVIVAGDFNLDASLQKEEIEKMFGKKSKLINSAPTRGDKSLDNFLVSNKLLKGKGN